MISMVIKKITNQKWLTMCLLLGIIFLVAVVSSFPMFKAGATDLMIRYEFEKYMEQKNEYPLRLTIWSHWKTNDNMTVDGAEERIETVKNKWQSELGFLGKKNEQCYYEINDIAARGSLFSAGMTIRPRYMPSISDHIVMCEGTNVEEMPKADGKYYCMISRKTADITQLAVGENIDSTSRIKLDSSGNPVKFEVCGIFDVSDTKDLFWIINPNGSEIVVYLTEDDLMKIYNDYDYTDVFGYANVLYDYKNVSNKTLDKVKVNTENITKADSDVRYNFTEIISKCINGRKTITIFIWVLQIPAIGLVISFIFMVSKQILEAEQNELAMHYSRGLLRRQIIAIYLVQSSIITVLGLILGIPMGCVLCKLAGASNNFLSFDMSNISLYKITVAMIPYGIVSACVGLIIIVIPVFKYSKITIVQHKSNMNIKKKMLWEKFFVDVCLLGLSLYFLYNYNNGIEAIRNSALNSNKMDPMIFMNIVLFIMAGGLFALRMSHYLVMLVYGIGKKHWKTAMYTSFLQITRNFSKQCFISVFLVLTVAIGIFYANAARTINLSKEYRVEYEAGADIRVKPVMGVKYIYQPRDNQDIYNYEYLEPDYIAYNMLLQEKLCDSITRVISTDNIIVKKDATSLEGCNLQAVVTDEFGESALFREEFNKNAHFYTYLNALAEHGTGILISKNLADKFKLSEGDSLKCMKYGETKDQKKYVHGEGTFKIVGIIENWPNYQAIKYNKAGEEEPNYLIVMNYASFIYYFELLPYEVWLNLAENVTYQDVYDYLKEQHVPIETKSAVQKIKEDISSEYMLQITNSLFTLSFIVAVVLCMIGFLIYWLSSISQRQLLFGVYRAMGMSTNEINAMLINEHFFSTFLSIVSGVGVGILTSVLFTKIFAIIYLPEKHNIGLTLSYNMLDFLKLSVIIIIMIIVCLVCLRRIIKKMDITKSLKLGED